MEYRSGRCEHCEPSVCLMQTHPELDSECVAINFRATQTTLLKERHVAGTCALERKRGRCLSVLRNECVSDVDSFVSVQRVWPFADKHGWTTMGWAVL